MGPNVNVKKQKAESSWVFPFHMGQETWRTWKTEEKEQKEEGVGAVWKMQSPSPMATRKTTCAPLQLHLPPPPHSQLLSSIHLTICCHFQLIFHLVFHKLFLWVMVFPFKGRNVGLSENFRGKKFFQFQLLEAFFIRNIFSCKQHWRITLCQAPLSS